MLQNAVEYQTNVKQTAPSSKINCHLCGVPVHFATSSLAYFNNEMQNENAEFVFLNIIL